MTTANGDGETMRPAMVACGVGIAWLMHVLPASNSLVAAQCIESSSFLRSLGAKMAFPRPSDVIHSL